MVRSLTTVLVALADPGLCSVAQKPAAPPRRIAVFGSSVANGTGDDLGQEGYTGRLRDAARAARMGSAEPVARRRQHQDDGAALRAGRRTRSEGPLSADGQSELRAARACRSATRGSRTARRRPRRTPSTASSSPACAASSSAAASITSCPIVTLCYTRNDFTAVEYEYTRRMNLAINAWDVPSVNFLGAVDDGTGKWAKGFWHDSLHPNAAGHDELARTFVPTLFDALEQGKPAPTAIRRRPASRVSRAARPRSASRRQSRCIPFAFGVTVRTRARRQRRQRQRLDADGGDGDEDRGARRRPRRAGVRDDDADERRRRFWRRSACRAACGSTRRRTAASCART